MTQLVKSEAGKLNRKHYPRSMQTKVVRFCYCVALFLMSCSDQNIEMIQADLGRLKPFPTSDEGIPVVILESFEAAPCKQDALSATVYKVKIAHQLDTLFVFETCKEILPTNKDQGLFMVEKSSKVSSQFLIPAKSTIPKGSKYVFGTLKRAIF
ncbi:hypothetical protein [Xanthocytophaga agilis]|uniref:Uncharacterized protein n=1 Tax=Xanthocytophaga agilis TaxID=3048010 RepID=A0AAE3UJZ2_9BACT|nr:hypothetical protein [Xanthocytophaga agilis]MDJ1506822.1 hypothetical protein [Xanthocytophaga agilis]